MELKEKQPGSLSERLEPYKQQFIHWARHSEQVAWLGDFLYQMGFWAEYVLVRAVRGLRAGVLWLAAALMRGAKKAALWLLQAAGGVLRKLVAPIVYLFNGFRHTRQSLQAAKEQGEPSAGVLRQAAVRGAMNFTALMKESMAYVLPLAAAGLFLFTVHTVVGYDYILKVEVDGKPVGYVANEAVFDSAREDLRRRIETVAANDGQEWDIKPTYTIAIEGTVMDEGEMADAILQASSKDIQEGIALYVDGQLIAVTTDRTRLDQTLADLKAPYEQPDNPNFRVEFTKHVELVEGIYFTSSFSKVNDVVNKLTGLEQAELTYTVQEGDSPWTIARDHELTVNELYALNPAMTESGYNMYVGDVLVVSQERPFLQIRTVERVTYTEPIPYETKKSPSEDYTFGTIKVVQEGQEGLKEITADIVRIDGVEAWRDIVETKVLQEPVTKEVLEGRRLPNGAIAAGGTGSGSIMWPVPAYRYVSRWMSSGHKGCDICAPRGTPIYAADNGVVTRAGWNGAGTNYGYSLIINHGNGMTTLYAHCDTLNVSAGQYVTQGQQIGTVGSTGWSTGNHLHFEIRINGSLVSARNYFPNF